MKKIRFWLVIFFGIYALICLGAYYGQVYLTFSVTKISSENKIQLLSKYDGRLKEIQWVNSAQDTLWGFSLLKENLKAINLSEGRLKQELGNYSQIEAIVGPNFGPSKYSERYSGRKILLYFGGNADDVWEAIQLLDLADYDVYSINYPGFGRSMGVPLESTIISNAQGFYNSLEIPVNTPVLIVGRSLGTGVAVQLSQWILSKKLKDVKLLETFLITPYNSLWKIGKHRYPYLPVKALITSPFESENYLSELKNKVSVVYAESDQIVPHHYTDSLVVKLQSRNLPQSLDIDTIFGFNHNSILQSPSLNALLHATH